MSNFEERPRFYQAKGRGEKIGLPDSYLLDKASITMGNYHNFKMLVDLLRLIPSYPDKNNFNRKKQLIKKRRKWQRRW